MGSFGKFTWRITDFSRRQSETRILSDVFTVGGCKWRIKVYPKGNGDVNWLSVYLLVADSARLPSGWCIDANYGLTIVNQFQSHDSTTFDAHPHQFKFPLDRIWGWRKFKSLTELHDSSKGYLVNDTLIVEAEIEVLNVSPPTIVLETFSSNLDKIITDAAQGRNSTESSSNGGLDVGQQADTNMGSFGKFTWRITDFSRRQSEKRIFSDVFTVGGCKWRIRVHPKGNGAVNWLSVYLSVADAARLPSGWCIEANYSMTIVNQFQSHDSTTFGTRSHQFKLPLASSWGWRKFKSLTELHDSSKGYLVNDTLIVEAEIEVLNVSPPTFVFGTFLSNLDKFITDVAQGRNSTESSSNGGLNMAKQSFKECLSDIFKLNIKDRLATSLETLSLSQAEIGLSSEQQRAVELFWNDFDDFVADFVAFEQENSEFELHKLAKDQKFDSMKNHHETHICNKQRLDDLTKKEEKAKKRMEKAKKIMEEAKSEKAKLISDWQMLVTESEETKSEYMALHKKVEEAEERKRIAGDRMSRSIAAWSSLKAHFAN